MKSKTYFVSKIQIDTYVRETWRYGGLKVIDLAEEVFFETVKSLYKPFKEIVFVV